MSNRDSLGFGDLLPQDVVDIFAQEKTGKRGRKKRSHSLGRALGWLKGKKRKDVGAKGQSLGLGPALDLALDGHPAGHQGAPKGGQKTAVPKRDDDDKTQAPPLFQENVFIEASRPKYLENLHTEALEGLKMMQQEETNNGVEYQDNESTISTMTHTDGEGGGFMTDSTIADSTSVVSVQSSVSTRSSRSGLTRQGSTFRPLNSGRKEKTKTRRRHRKTVGGIPQHVQRELGLDRVGWAVTQKLDEEQLYNGETDDSPTTDRPPQAAESQTGGNVQDMNVNQPLNKDQLEQLGATHAGHRDDLALLHCLGPDLSGEQRPRSLAVPWMTTANSLQQEPPSPVMSMSPQAAYMSKIIPNAVLPPSIDVVEISRGRSRNSVRTVSKSSLVLSSPAPSRASSRASSSRASTVRSSASRHNPPNLSDSSCWSNSESSETLVSDSSTISSSSTPRQKRSEDGDASAKEDKVSVHSSISKPTKSTSNGKLINKGNEVKKEGQFARSLSVIKSKRAPPPPNRSYSLHNKMKRRSRDLAEVRVPSGESSLHTISASGDENEKNKSGSSPVSSRVIDSPGYNADTSSLDDSTGSVSFSPIRSQLQAAKAAEAAKMEETVSKNASQEKGEPLKENKLSKVASPSSGYSSQEGTSAHASKPPHSSSPRHKRGILAKLQRLFPGSSPAASPPPPLTQPEAHENTKPTEDLKPDTSVDTASVSPSVRALRELFNIPPPPKVHAPPPPPPDVWAHSERSCELLLGPPAPGNTYAVVKKNPKDRRQQRKSPSASTEGSVKSLVAERKHKNPTTTVNGSLHVLETKKVQESGVLNVEIHEENNDRLVEQNVDLKGNRKVTEKDEKGRVSDILNGMLVKAAERREERLAAVREVEAKKTNMDTLPAISLVRIPPSPSPPPAHNPPQPPAKQTTEFASAASVQVVVSPESSWPPPPPPMGLGSPDELDFPLPPPPMFSEEELVIPVEVPPEKSIPGGATRSVLSVVKTECVRVTTEAEPQKPSTSQGIVHPPLNIPPPPPYSAPPPPLEAFPPPMIKVSLPPIIEVSPPPPPKEFSPPPPKEVSPPPPKEVSPPPPPKEVSPPPPPKEVSPPPPKEVSPPPPPKEVSPPPPPKEVSPPPLPKEVSPPPPKEVSPPPPKEVSPPPPPKEVSPPPLPKEVSPPPPKEVSPPPPKEVSPPPPPKEVSPPPPPKEVSPPPLPKEVSPPPPKEVSPPPPPKEVSPPPPPKEVSPLPPKEVSSPPPPKEVSPPPPRESSPPLVEEATPPLVEDVSATLVTVVSPSPVEEVSSLPPEEVSTLSTEEVSPPSSQENANQSSEEETPVSTFAPPQSIPPPPPLQSQPQLSEQEIDLPQENVPSESETNTVSSNSILTPPQSIPPPPPVQQPQVVPPNTDGPASEEASHSPPSEVSIPPSPENSVSTEEPQEPVSSPPASTENQIPEPTSAPVVQDEPTPIVTPSLLQMVKLRSVNSSPEPPKAEEEPETEVTMRDQEPSNQIPTSSASGEAPQKPIRRSLIMTSPTPTSPPAIVTSQPSMPKSQSLVLPPTSSSTVLSPTKKSPPAMTASPSMNLQEAIRLRTAARSKGGPASRLSLHSPTSPIDLHKSPTSTASFIFSKSNKKVVIETKPAPETKAPIQKNLEVSSVTKVVSEAEMAKKGVKVPPPVAKKPKTKGREIETSEGAEQTAGQEALQESIKDAAEKTNGTAGTVEGGTPST